MTMAGYIPGSGAAICSTGDAPVTYPERLY